MKVLFQLLIVFSTILFAEDGLVDERKTDLYYANGALAGSYESEYTQWVNKVQGFISNNSTLKPYIGKVDVAYNTTQSKAFDYYEIFLQKVDENPSLSIAWSTFVGLVNKYIKGVEKIVRFTDAVVKDATEADLSQQIAAYKQSISDGHAVISVSFGQGNFFTNSAFF